MARQVLAPFGFTDGQKREVWAAWQANPDGVERCALEAKAHGQRQGNSGAGLLLTMLRRGDHLLEPDPTTPLVTGWRAVYGEGHAAMSFVRDPAGTDPLPPGYDLTEYHHPVSPWHESDAEAEEKTPGTSAELFETIEKTSVENPELRGLLMRVGEAIDARSLDDAVAEHYDLGADRL